MDAGEARKLLVRVAGEAAALLRDYACTERFTERLGGERIRADVESESYIIDSLRAEGFRGVVVSEESGRVELGSRDGGVVLVDPLDGSSNYGNCIPWAAVSLAYAPPGSVGVRGVSAGVVYPVFFGDPISFGGGRCFLGGTLVGPKSPPARMLFVYMESSEAVEAVARVFHELGRPKVRSLGSAALEMAYAALGRAVAFIDVRSRLRNVDVAAALGLTLACGGEALRPGGDPLDVGLEMVEGVGAVISSSTAETAARIAGLLGGVRWRA